MFRFNSDLSEFEGYDGSIWKTLGGAVGDIEGDLMTQTGTEDLLIGSGTIDLNQ
jgi:predicted heme/steroid binding protein